MEEERVPTKTEQNLFKVLSHPIRVKILGIICENVKLSYTDLLSLLDIETGQLNFHLRNMEGLYDKDAEGNYMLTDEGKTARFILEQVQKHLTKKEEVYIRSQASLKKRAIATLIDYSLFFGVPVLTIMLLLSMEQFTLFRPLLLIFSFHFMVVVLFFSFAILAAMEMYNGQTIGKYLMKIRVVKEGGRKISVMESIIRNIVKVYFLPFDFLAGMIFLRGQGYLRFSDGYLKLQVWEVC